MGAVFASAARAPLTSVASVVEMTGDFTLTLPVMLAVAIATATSRGTELRHHLHHQAAAPRHRHRPRPLRRPVRGPHRRRRHAPLPGAAHRRAPSHPGRPARAATPLPGPVTHQRDPQVLFASESLTQALRQLELYGRDGLPVLSDDGQHLQGWITSQNVLQAVARQISAARATATGTPHAAGRTSPARRMISREAPDPLHGYQVLEVTIPAGSPAAGQALGDITWPPGCVPVTVLDNRTLRDPDPGITLAPGDRINLLAPRSTQSRAITPARRTGQPARRASRRCAPTRTGTASRRQRPAPAAAVMPGAAVHVPCLTDVVTLLPEDAVPKPHP